MSSATAGTVEKVGPPWYVRKHQFNVHMSRDDGEHSSRVASLAALVHFRGLQRST